MRKVLVILPLLLANGWAVAQRQPKPTMAILPVLHRQHPTHRSDEVRRRIELAYKHAESKMKRAGFEVLPRNHVQKLLEREQFYISNVEDLSERALRRLRIEMGCDALFAVAIDYRERPFLEPKNPPRGEPSPRTVFDAVTGGSPNHTRVSCAARAWLLVDGHMELDDTFGEAFAGQENHAVWRAVEKVVDPWVAEFRKRRKRG